MYEVTVGDISTLSDTGYVPSSTHYCTTSCNHWYTSWYTYPTTIYKYQIKCPKCKASNWLELDQMRACTKCESMLKAVKAKADFEIEVND